MNQDAGQGAGWSAAKASPFALRAMADRMAGQSGLRRLCEMGSRGLSENFVFGG
jgi:hypothetical protein